MPFSLLITHVKRLETELKQCTFICSNSHLLGIPTNPSCFTNKYSHYRMIRFSSTYIHVTLAHCNSTDLTSKAFQRITYVSCSYSYPLYSALELPPPRLPINPWRRAALDSGENARWLHLWHRSTDILCGGHLLQVVLMSMKMSHHLDEMCQQMRSSPRTVLGLWTMRQCGSLVC